MDHGIMDYGIWILSLLTILGNSGHFAPDGDDIYSMAKSNEISIFQHNLFTASQ